MINLITAFVIGFVTAALMISGIIFCSSRVYRIRKVLGIALIFFGIMMSKDFLYLFDAVQENKYLYNTLILLDNWAVVFGCLYVLELLRPGYVTFRTFLYHLSGYVFFTLLYIFTRSDLAYDLNFIFVGLYVVANVVFLVYFNIRYKRMIKMKYSHRDRNMNVRWIWLCVLLLLFLFLYWLASASRAITLYDLSYYLLMFMTWSFIIYKTYKMPELNQEDVREFVLEENMIKTKDPSPKEHYPFSARLTELRKNGYFSEHPQLTLAELATELNTNRTTLSTFINKELQSTFYDMVNEARLEAAEKYLNAPNSHLTQDELAFKVGFNSVSTFKRAFYKKYSMSLSDFKKKKEFY